VKVLKKKKDFFFLYSQASKFLIIKLLSLVNWCIWIAS